MLNSVMLIGRLTKDPEIRVLPSGMKVATILVAFNRSYKDKNNQWQEESHFFEVECFGKLAERLGSFKKGNQVLVEGELRQDRWEDPSGGKRSKVKIVADRVVSLDKPAATKSAPTSPSVSVETEETDDVVPW